MTALRQFFAASVLALTLTISVSAGEISTGIASPQPTPTTPIAQGEITTGITGEITTMNADADAVSGSATDAAVALLQSVLSLL